MIFQEIEESQHINSKTLIYFTDVPKKGNCPASAPGMAGLCITECSSDSDCSGTRKCCGNGCGMTCQEPEDMSPCQVNTFCNVQK